MSLTGKIGAWLLAVALIFGAGMMVGWKLFRPKPMAQVAVAPAAAQKQADGSLILERRPEATPQPAQQVPAGAKVERVVKVVVRSTPTPPSTSGPALQGAAIPTAPDTTVDLSLIRMPDKSERVVASSPDGTVVGGLDVPVAVADEPKVYKWGVGPVVGIGPNGEVSKGLMLMRNLGSRFTATFEATRDQFSNQNPGVSCRAAIVFRF